MILFAHLVRLKTETTSPHQTTHTICIALRESPAYRLFVLVHLYHSIEQDENKSDDSLLKASDCITWPKMAHFSFNFKSNSSYFRYPFPRDNDDSFQGRAHAWVKCWLLFFCVGNCLYICIPTHFISFEPVALNVPLTLAMPFIALIHPIGLNSDFLFLGWLPTKVTETILPWCWTLIYLYMHPHLHQELRHRTMTKKKKEKKSLTERYCCNKLKLLWVLLILTLRHTNLSLVNIINN